MINDQGKEKCPFYFEVVSIKDLITKPCVLMSCLNDMVRKQMCDSIKDKDAFRFLPGKRKLCPQFRLKFMEFHNYDPQKMI
jgi:hypothetical protein